MLSRGPRARVLVLVLAQEPGPGVARALVLAQEWGPGVARALVLAQAWGLGEQAEKGPEAAPTLPLWLARLVRPLAWPPPRSGPMGERSVASGRSLSGLLLGDCHRDDADGLHRRDVLAVALRVGSCCGDPVDNIHSRGDLAED